MTILTVDHLGHHTLQIPDAGDELRHYRCRISRPEGGGVRVTLARCDTDAVHTVERTPVPNRQSHWRCSCASFKYSQRPKWTCKHIEHCRPFLAALTELTGVIL